MRHGTASVASGTALARPGKDRKSRHSGPSRGVVAPPKGFGPTGIVAPVGPSFHSAFAAIGAALVTFAEFRGHVFGPGIDGASMDTAYTCSRCGRSITVCVQDGLLQVSGGALRSCARRWHPLSAEPERLIPVVESAGPLDA